MSGVDEADRIDDATPQPGDDGTFADDVSFDVDGEFDDDSALDSAALDGDVPEGAVHEVAPSVQGSLPLDVRTGDARVDAAVEPLRDLDALPVGDHVAVFTQVHRDLQDALLTLDED